MTQEPSPPTSPSPPSTPSPESSDPDDKKAEDLAARGFTRAKAFLIGLPSLTRPPIQKVIGPCSEK